MSNKNDIENLHLENNEELEIEYNDDFSCDKTKSLNKFTSKLEINKEFYLDNSCKNFSKSLGFNFRQCFAPRSKTRKSSKNPTPLIFTKSTNFSNLNTQEHMITEDAMSEKESFSNVENSFSSDSEDENENLTNNNNKKTEILNNNSICEKNDIKIENLNKNNFQNISKDKIKENKIKVYEHKTIGNFQTQNIKDENSKENIKSIRNNLFRIKLKYLNKKNKEMEYIIKEKDKIKYRLDIVKIERKDELKNEYKIIPISKINENNYNNSDEDNGKDMNKFRITISYCNSKLNKEINKINEDKGITIYEILKKNKKNKKT